MTNCIDAWEQSEEGKVSEGKGGNPAPENSKG
jgi:hypothetical protein